MTGPDIMDQLQADVLGILSNAPRLADARKLNYAQGDIASELQKAISATAPGETGKPGLVLIVIPPEVTEAEKNLPSPVLKIRQDVQVIEHVAINRSHGGTKIRAGQAAMLALQSLHHAGIGTHVIYAERRPVFPLPVKSGYLSYTVSVWITTDGVDGPARTPGVTVTTADDEITLACSDGAAEIWYSADGSFPGPNGTATLYSDPIPAPAAGTVIRAAAFSTGKNPSDILQFQVTA